MEDLAELIRRNPSRPLQLFHASCELPLCNTVTVARTHWQRLRGLLGGPALQPDSGLLLLPSKGIHTFGMRYAIDAVLLDERLRVLYVYDDVKPNRIRLAKRQTHSVLELPSGDAHRAGIAKGDCLRFEARSLLTPPLKSAHAGHQPTRLSFGLKLLIAVVLCMQVSVCWLTRQRSLGGQIDLRAYYTAGTLARTGPVSSIYDDAAEQQLQQSIFRYDGWLTLHFLYPPFAVLPYVPMSLLSYRMAFFAVMAGNLACLFFCAWLLVRQHPEWQLSAHMLFFIYLCFFPCAVTLMQAQVSFVLLLTVTLLYCFERSGRPVLAGLCFSVGLIKFQIMLPVVLLYLLWRRYRVVAGFAIGSIGLLLLSLLLTGTAGLRAYATRLHNLSESTLLDQQAAHLLYGMQVACDPNLHGLATVLMGSGAHSALLTAGLSLLVLLWSVRQVPSTATAVTAALLLSYHLQAYGMVLLLLPLTLLFMGLKFSTQERQKTRVAEWLLIGSFALLSPPLTYWFLVRGSTVWYVAASFATLSAAVLHSSKRDKRIAVQAPTGIPTLAASNA